MNTPMIDYMAQTLERARIDEKAHRGWLTQEAASQHSGQANGINAVRQFGRWSIGRLVQQIIGGMSESARAAEETVVPYR